MTGATTTSRRVLVRPTRDDLVDAAALAVLSCLALIGLRTTYAGWTYFLVGAIGLLLGLVLAHLANALRLPAIVLVVLTPAVFFLLGGAVALRAAPGGSALPSPHTVRGLATISVHGWKQLLTTLPPVDGTGALLVLPYLLGMAVGAGGFTLARRTAVAFVPVLAPFAILVVVILLGTATPAARLLQGAVFGVVALGWVALRAQRRCPPVTGSAGRATRALLALAVLAVVGAGTALVGSHVPGSGSHSRLVLRTYVEPPTDPQAYPSPLAGFRNYTDWKKTSLNNKTLFTVDGLPPGSAMRIATLDDYTGTVWAAANDPHGTGLAADTFQKVGSTIDNPAPGPSYIVSVRLADAYSQAWLPDAGAVQHVSFTGPNRDTRAAQFRYDLSTGTGLVTGGLKGGDSYTLRVAGDTRRPLLPADQVMQSADGSGSGAFLSSYAKLWSGHSANATAAVLDLGKYLLANGKYTNGGDGFEYYLPGHSQARLQKFVTGVVAGMPLVGDDEQYAAAYALMIGDLGTPARVVLGALPRDGIVTGADVHAWVEVQLADGTWRSIDTDTFMSHNAPVKKQQQQQQQRAGQIVPPPAAGRPHTNLDDTDQSDSQSSRLVPVAKARAKEAPLVHVPAFVATAARWAGPPVLAIVLLLALIVLAKTWRRFLRRTRGPASTRVMRGWREIVDHAADLGSRVPTRRTRREQGRALQALGVGELATLADAHIFGPEPPADGDVAEYWRRVRAARRQMSRGVGPWRRLRAVFTLASFRRYGPRSAT